MESAIVDSSATAPTDAEELREPLCAILEGGAARDQFAEMLDSFDFEGLARAVRELEQGAE